MDELTFTQTEDNEVRITFKDHEAAGITMSSFGNANDYIDAGVKAGHKREDYEIQVRKVFKFTSPWVRA